MLREVFPVTTSDRLYFNQCGDAEKGITTGELYLPYSSYKVMLLLFMSTSLPHLAMAHPALGTQELGWPSRDLSLNH